MKGILKKIWFPAAVVCFLAIQTAAMDMRDAWVPRHSSPEAVMDTIKYRNQFIKDRNFRSNDSLYLTPIMDSVAIPSARDSIFPPDSLRDIDPFRYKYYVALVDSATHRFVSDSLKAAGDSIDWPILDSLYSADSIVKAKAAFDKWYAGLSKIDRKKYDNEVKERIKKHISDSIQARKDSVKFIRDSIRENTPRILETFALADSMQYKRIIQWTHEREFHKMDVQLPDTGYNYHYYDYPIFRKDVNATWLGVAGSPVQYYNYFNRGSENGVAFFEPYESWSYSPSTLPMYNTKTPYTELAYFGTLFANSDKESDNLHVMTTQNIFPELNFTLEYDRFGGNGMMENEKTINKTYVASANYLGRKYMMHTGIISNKISHGENGGTSDNTMVTDTTLDAREFPVYLSSASTELKKTSLFLDQQYRIPFTFVKRLKYRKELKAERAYRDSVIATGDSAAIAQMQELLALKEQEREKNDTTGNKDITSAFIGHSSEYSVFSRTYTDEIAASDASGREFYENFYYNPTKSEDHQRVTKLENRIFIRLQPWSSEAFISKLNIGAGNRIMKFSNFDYFSFLGTAKKTTWNSSFAYAGIEGQIGRYVQWDAKGDFVFTGPESKDMGIKANASFNMFPFRRHPESPLSFNFHFETSLKEPDYYWQHYFSNHYIWNNDFDKISTTKIQGSISIPHWNLGLDVGYALLDKNIYFDSTGVIRQNTSPMSVFSATLTKNFNLFNFLHLDNKVLFEVSSDEDVLPVPTLAVNARYYIQFNVKKNVMQMQLGANAWYNTKFYTPGWLPSVGAFYNQREVKYNNGPIIDAFVNIQWKRACIFIKFENIGQGWPMDKNDYFTANHYIRTQRSIKFGIFWPFYLQPTLNRQVQAGAGLAGSASRRSGNSER